MRGGPGLAGRDVAALLADVAGPPVPIEAIVHADDVTLARSHFDGPQAAFAYRDGAHRIIGVNTTTSPRRQRFAIAHALGHLRLHTRRPLIVCHSIVVERSDHGSWPTPAEEDEANTFAGSLLMPRDMLAAELGRRVAAGDFDSRDQLIRETARAFGVSNEAMGWRLITLGMMSG